MVLTAMHHRSTFGLCTTVMHMEAIMKVRDMAQVILRIEPEVKAWLERKSKQDERSQNWLVAKALREAMQRDEQITQA